MWVGGTHYNQAPMPEWSKGVDLRPTIVKIRAFEPRSVQTSCIWVKYTTFSYSVVVITLDFESSDPDSISGGRKLLAFML